MVLIPRSTRFNSSDLYLEIPTIVLIIKRALFPELLTFRYKVGRYLADFFYASMWG